MSAMIAHPPLHVAYYAGPTGKPYRLLRHLASVAVAASIADEPFAARARLSWAHRGVERDVDASLIATRTVGWHLPLHELTEDAIATEVEALRCADVIVFMADGRRHTLALNRSLVRVLSDDVVAVGRGSEVPVVFQIHRYPASEGPEATIEELRAALVWPRCEYVEAHPREKRGAAEALGSAIDIHDELARGHK